MIGFWFLVLILVWDEQDPALNATSSDGVKKMYEDYKYWYTTLMYEVRELVWRLSDIIGDTQLRQILSSGQPLTKILDIHVHEKVYISMYRDDHSQKQDNQITSKYKEIKKESIEIIEITDSEGGSNH
jgi:hypothetical protein